MEYMDIALDQPLPAVLRVTLSRPRVKNAYRTTTCTELLDVVRRFADDDGLRVMILAGANGAFCSGGDLTSETEKEVGDARQMGHAMVLRDGFHAVLRALESIDKPVIASVDGPAISGGLSLSLACHLRIASERASAGDAAARVGLLPDDGGAWLFPRFMGLDRALRMTLLGEIYPAQRAVDLNLFTEVVPVAAHERRVLEIAESLATGAPLAIRSSIRMMTRALGQSLDRSLQDAEAAVCFVNHSADVAEGVTAFLERRRPHFTGR